MTSDLERLKAEAAAAQAAAEAAAAEAAAKAAAAKAAALAAQLAQAQAADPAAASASSVEPLQAASDSSERIPEDAPAQAQKLASPPAEEPADERTLALRAAYSPSGAAVTVGALRRADGGADPQTLIRVSASMFNRHGLIAGATGTGKTRTLQLLAESLSDLGVPVLLSDVKGDLTGIAQAGTSSEKLAARTASNGQVWTPSPYPVQFMTIGDATDAAPGVSLRARVSDMGPLLLARALELNETQQQALQLVFAWADQNGLLLDDLKDLKSVVSYLVSDEGKPQLKQIGGISTATAGVILRSVSALESQGADRFFGTPAFDTADLMAQSGGRGVVNVLRMLDLDRRPALVSTFLMWVLADLFAHLPEVGDSDRPRLVFFFDEAHLLFKDASKEFLRQVVQTVRLIRSKGVGVFFVTQSPSDIPADVLGQLAGRVQHALRAFTPSDAKVLKETVKTFPNSDYDLEELLTTLGTGQALVTFLSEDGAPTPVVPTRLWAPRSVMGPAAPAVVSGLVASSALVSKYGQRTDGVSAFESLEQRAQQQQLEQERARAEAERVQYERQARQSAPRSSGRSAPQSTMERALGSMARSIGTQLGREITRSIFGTRRRR